MLYVMNADDKVSFPTERPRGNITEHLLNSSAGAEGEERRNGKNLLDWLGFGVGGDTDPYLSKANAACLEVRTLKYRLYIQCHFYRNLKIVQNSNNSMYFAF